MAKLDIVVISDPGKFDGFYFLQGLMNVGEGYATDVASMVKYVLTHVKSGDTIIALTIHGHGNENGQYIGKDWFSLASNVPTSALRRTCVTLALHTRLSSWALCD